MRTVSILATGGLRDLLGGDKASMGFAQCRIRIGMKSYPVKYPSPTLVTINELRSSVET